jgi:hypothetical protein
MTILDSLTPDLGLLAAPDVAPWFVAGFLIGTLLTLATVNAVQELTHARKMRALRQLIPGGFHDPLSPEQ